MSGIYKIGPTLHAWGTTVSHIMSESETISVPQESTELISYKALDERLYDLSDEERSFLKEQSGIQDDDELKEHIIQVQTEAYKVGNLTPRKS